MNMKCEVGMVNCVERIMNCEIETVQVGSVKCEMQNLWSVDSVEGHKSCETKNVEL